MQADLHELIDAAMQKLGTKGENGDIHCRVTIQTTKVVITLTLPEFYVEPTMDWSK